MTDRIGIRSFLIAEGDVHLETLVMQGFLERRVRGVALSVVEEREDGAAVLGNPRDVVTRDMYVVPLMPGVAFPDEQSRLAYYAFMQDTLERMAD